MFACWNIALNVRNTAPIAAASAPKPQQRDEHEAAPGGEEKHVHRVQVVGTEAVDALRAVVHLVRQSPQEVDAVNGPVIPVVHEFVDQDADRGTPERPETAEIEQRVVPEQGCPADRDLHRKPDGRYGDDDAASAPGALLRIAARTAKRVEKNETRDQCESEVAQ